MKKRKMKMGEALVGMKRRGSQLGKEKVSNCETIVFQGEVCKHKDRSTYLLKQNMVVVWVVCVV